MFEALKTFVKQPYSTITLLTGALLILFPCVTINRDHDWITHTPVPLFLAIVGGTLIFASLVIFAYSLKPKPDFQYLRERRGKLSITISGCEVTVIEGRVEDEFGSDAVVVLPWNEYFDRACAEDRSSALGAYVSKVFSGQIEQFVDLVQNEAKKYFGEGTPKQKTKEEQDRSFRCGRCMLLQMPLGKEISLAVISTAAQAAERGLSAQILGLFEGIRELSKKLADARKTEVVMPILGSGHGRIHAPYALMSILLAIAEVVRSGDSAQGIKRLTIVNFRKNPDSLPQIERTTVRNIMNLIASQSQNL